MAIGKDTAFGRDPGVEPPDPDDPAGLLDRLPTAWEGDFDEIQGLDPELEKRKVSALERIADALEHQVKRG